MRTEAQLAAYVSLILGHALVLFLGIRYRIGRGRTQRLLTTILSLALIWVVALSLLGLLFTGSWWHWVWYRTAQMGLVLLALLMAGLARAFVGRIGRRWALWR